MKTGDRVLKSSGKPFKSGLYVGTIKDIWVDKYFVERVLMDDGSIIELNICPLELALELVQGKIKMLKIIGADPDNNNKVVVKENGEVKSVDIDTIYSCELEKFVTRMAYYSQELYSIDNILMDICFEPVAYALSCFFAQNTVNGDEGVDAECFINYFDSIKTSRKIWWME
jgi:hypothetical protein